MNKQINNSIYEKRRKELIDAKKNDWTNLHISSYAEEQYFNAVGGNATIKKLILSERKDPFLIGRLGETELRTASVYLMHRLALRQLWRNSFDICNNAGFFPREIFRIKRFTNEYANAIANADYLGYFLWENEESFIMGYKKELRGCFPGSILDPLYIEHPWTSALKSKKVLIISPFSETIKKQYKNKDLLFHNNTEILPEFELRTIKAVQSVGGHGADGFKDWFEALEYMKSEVDNVDFDIALLGCGAYGMPLASHIKSIGKQAIYMGGCLQLMFGIIGKRWEQKDYVQKYINEYWVRPASNEQPANRNTVEGGCYW